ncbi:DUF4827 domain-containing protein [Bacteroides heparinolyticus]|uniref:DUF4827 domain-containing protein n=1 Tax=Prevotella heparinolytica TaxID=28113 RepID=UPI0035A01EC5
MKKLTFLWLFLLLLGTVFQACSNTKTYAEMLEEERDAISLFIQDSAINVISESEFQANNYTTDTSKNEFVAFSNGVYLQIIDAGSTNEADTFKTNEILTVRYLEKNITTRALTCFNIPLEDYMDNYFVYSTPLSFRFQKIVSSSVTLTGKIVEPYDYLWYSAYGSSTNGLAIPQGWLSVMEYLSDGANIRLIVPSKMGHTSSSNNVIPYYYEIRELKKANS